MEERRFCYDADGELLVVPQHGALTFATEMGRLVVAPGEIDARVQERQMHDSILST